MYKKLFIILLSGVLFLACENNQQQKAVIAAADDFEISLDSFAKSYLDEFLYSPVDVQDSDKLRKKHLETRIARHYLAELAQDESLDTLSAFKHIMKAESVAVIIHGLYEKEIQSQLAPITEAELKDAFVKMKTRLHVKHLYSKTKHGIDSLYEELNNNKSFEKLAQPVFGDSSKNSGRDLGFISWGDMNLDFENAAYQLKIGEISQPIETKLGWHIIKLENKIINPIIRESEFMARKDGLRKRLIHRYLKNQSDWRIKRLMESKKVVLNVPLILEIEKNFHKENITPAISGTELAHNYKSLFDQYQYKAIATFNGGQLTVKDFREHLYTVPAKAIARGVYSAVAMSLRNYFLLQIAEQKKIDQYVKETIDDKREHLLSNLFINDYANKTSLTDNDCLDYYSENKDKLYINKKMHVLEILFESEDQARKILGQLITIKANKAQFQEKARQYTIRPEMKKSGGDLGIITKSDYGPLGLACYSARKGGIGGPVQTEHGFSIYMVVDYTFENIPFHEVKDEIENKMDRNKSYYFFEKFKKQICDSVDIFIDNQLLYHGF